MTTGGELVVKGLEESGIRLAFGIPAVHNLSIYDALYDSSLIRSVSVKHEQAAGFMAIGSAFSSGKPAVCIVGSGPGATNMLTPVAEAYLDSTPMAVIAGGIRTASAGKGSLHEVNQLAMFEPVTKQAAKLANLGSLAVDVKRAIEFSTTNRPRPVFLEIPFDVLASKVENYVSIFPAQPIPAQPPGKEIISSVLKLLEKSTKPLIVVGGGVNSSQAWNELAELARKIHSPVVSTISAKGVFPETDPLSLGQLWDEIARKTANQADLVIALGCRFSERSTASWRLQFNAPLIQVDIDQQELGRNYPVSLPILSDVRIFLQALFLSLDERATYRERDLWVEGLDEEKAREEREYEKYDSLLTTRVRPQTVIREMQHVMPDDTLVVAETGYAFWWSALLLKVGRPKSYLSPSGNSTLGFGYPAALGAKCARPERSVICLVGDGGFLFSCQEIVTAVEEKIPLVTIIFDDGGYAAIREYQSSGYDGRFIGVDFTNCPNFVRMAESMGAEGIIVTSEDEIGSTIKEALGSKKSVVIDIKIGRDERVLPSFFTQVYRKSS